jgi:hypothetical protein
MTDSERLARIEKKVDDLGLRFDDFRVAVESRVAKLEVKAAVAGTLGGGLGALLAQLVTR